jgi:arylsulfatase A-like enzyme
MQCGLTAHMLPPPLTMHADGGDDVMVMMWLLLQWHLGYYKWAFTPTYRGFDSYFGYYEGLEDYFRHSQKGTIPALTAYDLHRESRPSCGPNCSLVPDKRGLYSTNVFSEEAVELIAALATEPPWFIYLCYQSVHEPYQVPAVYRERYLNSSNHLNFSSWSRGQQTMAAMLACLDDGIANITRALKGTAQMEETVVVLTSDNGGTGPSSNWSAGVARSPPRLLVITISFLPRI